MLSVIKNGEIEAALSKNKKKNGIELIDPENTACKIKFQLLRM
jgi:hypothetical protein